MRAKAKKAKTKDGKGEKKHNEDVEAAKAVTAFEGENDIEVDTILSSKEEFWRGATTVRSMKAIEYDNCSSHARLWRQAKLLRQGRAASWVFQAAWQWPGFGHFSRHAPGFVQAPFWWRSSK